MDSAIFKAYDIRGIYPDQLDEDGVKAIANAFAEQLKPKTVVVGRDMRASSVPLSKALTETLEANGIEVIDIGLSSTPMMYWASLHFKADGGIVVSASHNPAQYNGMKMVGKEAVPIAGETGIYDMRDRIASGDPFTSADQLGSVRQEDVLSLYVDGTFDFVKPDEIVDFKVVVDAGNGMGGQVIPKLFDKLPQLDLVPMHLELDGTFPNHPADPLKEENVKDLKVKIKAESAHLGVAIDGDSDRIVFIDENGETVPADILTGLLAEQALAEHKGGTVLYDVRSSWATKEAIERAGGKAVMSRVGHSLIKAQMREENAVFAGELSGHYYLSEVGYFEAPYVVLLYVLRLMTKTGKSLSELVAPLRTYFASGEINSDVEDKQGKMGQLMDLYKDKASTVSTIDGIRLEFDDWWFNVRPSNTEPLLRLNLEAKSQERMADKRDEILAIIRS